ncbi:hypothetical protein [Legionella quateirensis]|nr:hypothetical protein [Legionella quateirensis]
MNPIKTNPWLEPINSKYDINCPVTEWNEHLLPDWLFYVPKTKDSFISPAAQFKPVAALNGSPWQSTTSPKLQKQAKTLIIDTHFYINGLQEHDLIAQIEWFKRQEIHIYLCIEREGRKSLVSCNEPDHNFEEDIDFLGQFDESTDYEQLTAGKNLVRDKTVVLNNERSQDLFACMHQQKRHLVSKNYGANEDSASSNPEYRFYDASPYSIHIPYAITAQNQVMKAADYPICMNPQMECSNGTDLIDKLIQYPYLALQLLEQNINLITHELVSVFYHKLPELRTTIIPFCYDLIGQSPTTNMDYYILLKNKLNVHQLPLEQFRLQTASDLTRLQLAYPNLEERLDILLNLVDARELDASELVEVFPHKAHAIFRHSPPRRLYQLSAYINAVPEDADSIIQHHEMLILYEMNPQSFTFSAPDFWIIFQNAKSTKAQLNELVEPYLSTIEFLINYLACEPPEFEFFFENIPLLNQLNKNQFIAILRRNPKMASYLLKYLNTQLTFFDIERLTYQELKRSLYDVFQPQVRYSSDVITLLSLYPEQYDQIIEEYKIVLEDSRTLLYVNTLPPEVALKLMKLYPNKAKFREAPPRFTNPDWQKPQFIAHMLKQLDKNDSAVNSLVLFYNQLAYLCHDLADQIIAEQIPVITKEQQLSGFISQRGGKNSAIFENHDSLNMNRVNYTDMQMLLYTPAFSHPERVPQYNECTALNIGMLEDTLEINFRNFPNLISLKINLCTASPLKIQQFFDDLSQYCPKLTHLSVPESLMNQSCHLPYKINYKKEIKLKKSHTPKLELSHNLMSLTGESSDQGAASPFRSSSSLFVANNALPNSTLSSNSSNSFNMVKTGELLNGRGTKPHRMRTGIIELNEDLSSQHYQIPELYSLPLPQQLTPELINECRLRQDGFYYHLTLQIAANQPVRLLSADAQDDLIALDSQGVEIELMRGSDDFYYVKTDRECTLSYVIKAPEPQNTMNYGCLNTNDPIKEILDNYLNLPNYTPESKESISKLITETFPEWFERLYKAGQGSGQERCYAVWFQIAKNPATKDRARLVDIDNNHIRLEIRDLEGRWLQIDLGGIQSHRSYDNRHSYKAQPSSSAQNSQNISSSNNNQIPNAQASSSGSNPCAPNQFRINGFKEDSNSTSTFQQLETLISNHQTPKIVNHLEQVFDYTQFPVLLIHQNRELCAQQFLHQAKSHNRPVFFLHDPNQIKVGKDQIHLESNAPTISTIDALDLFKKEIRGNPDAMILIDWAAFSPQQQVALNSIIDKKHSLYNKKLNFKIYSLCPELSNDSSFVSRHPHLIKPVLPVPERPIDQAARHYNVDLKGLPDWQETLFGPILLNNNQLEWHKSEFVLALEDNNPQTLLINLSNIPVDAKQQLNTLLQRAKAQGYLEYHHAKIPVPKQVQFQLESTEFNFKKFQPVDLIRKINSTQLPPECQVINTELFDFLLTNKKIDQGQYQIIPGWLEQAKGNRLSLFITSELSDNQWYCLLERAQFYQVELTLFCAKGVVIPNKIIVNQKPKPEPIRGDSIDEPLVYLSSQPQKCKTADENTLCFAIEDYNYQDLMTCVSYHYQNNQFTDFNEQTSDVLKALKQGKTVVLYGEFSTALLHALQPIILSQASQNDKPWPGQLILSIDKKCRPDLRFLPKHRVKSIEFTAKNEQKPNVIYKELTDASMDLSDSTQKAERYLFDRLAVLIDAINNHPIIAMIGKTGVGKTFLIRELKRKYPEHYTIYHELEHFEEFALDDSDKIKVLFLDEVNIANKHLTMLEPLKDGGNPRVLYKGRIYQLTDKHRIVCASNALNYGGGRVKQKLFAEQDIPELHLEEMPAYFIYEQLLKPIYRTMAPYIKEQDFKNKCLHFLTQYKQSRLNQEHKICVRNLQEWVVTFAMQLLKHQPETFLKKRKIDVDNHVTDIVITDSMSSIHKNLRRSIEIRKQRYLERRDCVWGLNGCLIEGRPGMGKTELIRYRLAKSGYTQIKPGEDAPKNTLTYIKIDASLPDELNKTYIRKAFNQGQIVWLDEVNSVLDDGFEHWMNAFLSGFDPDTHHKAQIPGFMLLVTANGIGMEGRSLIGPAFRGRLTQLTMPEPTGKDLDMIIENKLADQLEETQRHTMAQELVQLMEKNKNLTLREITPKLKLISQIYMDIPRVENVLNII